MKIQEQRSEHGMFWLAENKEKRVWGTLHIDEAGEAKVETFGALLPEWAEGMHKIVGRIKGGTEPVTLIDCFPVNTQVAISGADGEDWNRQTCLVNVVIEGAEFGEGEEVAFERALVEISNLPKWVNPNVVEFTYPEERSKRNGLIVSKNERPDETTRVRVQSKDIELTMRFSPKENWGTDGPIRRYSIQDHCSLILERVDGSKMPLDEVLPVTGAIQDLLSVCCNEAPIVTNLSLKYEKGDLIPIKAYVPTRSMDSEGKEEKARPALNFNDVGGMEGIARWLEIDERYGPPVSLLTSNWYNDRAYGEDKLSRMFTAVEGLVSRKENRTRASITIDELAKFVDGAIPDFESLVNRKANEWAKQVKQIRDQRISHSDPSSTLAPDGLEIHVMTNILYTAGTSFLLAEMGLAADQIRRYIHACRRYMLLGEQQ